MYCIAEFTGVNGKKEIAVVAKSWLVGDRKCYWPSHIKTNKQLEDELMRGTPADTQTWSLFEARVVGKKFFESYEKAEASLSQAQFHSELSGDENERRRKRKRNQIEVDADSESSDNEVTTPRKRPNKTKQSASRKLPCPPSPPCSLTPGPSHKLVAVADILPVTPREERRNAGFPNGKGFDDPRFVDYNLPVPCAQSRVLSIEPNISTLCRQETDLTTCRNLDAGFLPQRRDELVTVSSDMLKSILTNQELLMAKIDIILDLQRTILKGRDVQRETRGSSNLRLPIGSESAFDDLESLLKEKTEIKSDLVRILETKGGNNPNQVVYRVMGALMTDELMLQFTFAGQTGKKSFKNTIALTCVCDAVRNQPMGSALKDKDIERAVDYWLKKASTRILARKLRESKSNGIGGAVPATDF